MQTTLRSAWIYGLLLAVWVLVIAWQMEEHVRVRDEARAVLVNRAKDISTTLSIVIRSQRRFGGIVSKERLEASLTELVKQQEAELRGVALLNATGGMVASAGAGTDLQPGKVAGTTERWGEQTVTLINPVDLGTNVAKDIEGSNPTIIFSLQDFPSPFGTNRTGPPPERRRPGPPESGPDETSTNDTAGPPRGGRWEPPPPPPEDGTNRTRMRTGGFRPRFGRPRWMSEEEYQMILQKQGVHSMVLVMSTRPVHIVASQDFWLRSIIAVLATISLVGSGFVWRSVGKSSDLQLRLVRASEMNTHLKELNLAAAGLAHETRNPLNIIRGMAQMISRQSQASAETRDKSLAIVEQTDKVTAQLNEFINYSRPRELRRAKFNLDSVANEVVHTLGNDVEEKKINFVVKGESVAVEADEQLFRQALFNLALNAVQAVEENGLIEIAIQKAGSAEAILEIRDNGPGVAPENRSEIFKPYFTTHQKGTGLGLAVVQQIVLMHGWEIQCLPNDPRGAIFRITHLKIVN